MTPEPELEQASKPEADSRTLPTVVGEIRGWARDVFFAIGTAILIVVFLYQPVKVEGTSMLPELVDQERIFVNKFVSRIERIARKDIVVFWYPKDPTKSYIKRIVGMPGDVVEIRKGIVYVNEQELDEPYLTAEFKDLRTYPAVHVRSDQERIFVNKFVYRIARIARKDIVVFWYPKDPTKSYIKRIVGMPGDVVEIRKGIVYVNEQELDEPYLTAEFKDLRTYPAVHV